MDTQGKSQSQDSGKAGVETTIAIAEVEGILDELEPLYTEEAQEGVEALLEALGRSLSTGTFSLDDVGIYAEVEELQRGTLERIKVQRQRLAELRARL